MFMAKVMARNARLVKGGQECTIQLRQMCGK
jgi:hypothetical protein